VEPAAAFYPKFLPSENTTSLRIEFLHWQQSETASGTAPQTAVELLEPATQLGTHPVMCVLLQIYATLLVTTATGERYDLPVYTVFR